MPNPEIPSGDDSSDSRSEILKKVLEFFDDPLINDPKDFINRVRNRIQIRREGKLVVELCEDIAKEKVVLDNSAPVPLVESDEDLQDLIDLREEITGGDFEVIYRDSFTNRD